MIDWAQATVEELRANAIMHILLCYHGVDNSAECTRTRGFTMLSSKFYPELRDGVVSQREGHHGPDVLKQWRNMHIFE